MSPTKSNRISDKPKSLFSGSFALIGYRLVAVFVSYLFTWLIARFYGASVVGTFALMNVVVLVGVLLSKVGLDTFFLREVSRFRASNDQAGLQRTYSHIVGIQLFSGVAVSLLIYTISEEIGKHVFKNVQLVGILKYAALIILPLTFSVLHAEGLRGTRKLFWYLSMTRIWPFLLSGLAMIFLYLTHAADSIYFFWSYFTAVIATSVFGFWIWNRHSMTVLKVRFSRSTTLKYLKQSAPMMLSSSMFLLMSWTDTFMLGLFEDTTQVGYYHVAVKVSNMVAIVLYGINGIAAPKMAASWGIRDNKTLSRVISGAATLSFALSVPIVLGIIFFRSQLLELFGEGMETAAIALVFLSLGQFINGSCGSVMNILQMTNHQSYGQNILISAGAINIILNYSLIPSYGIEGAALATGISTAYWNIMSVIVVRWKIGYWSLPFVSGVTGVKQMLKGKS